MTNSEIIIRDKQTGTEIDTVHDVWTAALRIKQFEDQDKQDGCFEKNFYEFVPANDKLDSNPITFYETSIYYGDSSDDRYFAYKADARNWLKVTLNHLSASEKERIIVACVNEIVIFTESGRTAHRGEFKSWLDDIMDGTIYSSFDADASILRSEEMEVK